MRPKAEVKLEGLGVRGNGHEFPISVPPSSSCPFALSCAMNFPRFPPIAAGLVLVLSLAACGGHSTNRPERAKVPGSDDGFTPVQLVKTDIDRVAEAHLRDAYFSLRALTEKLYRRNPREWKKSGQAGVDAAMARLFDQAHGWSFKELEGRRGVDALRLAFRDDYAGDRVLALAAGLGGMLDSAFGGKREFFLLDDLDPQKFYDSARNVEIVAWKLNSARDATGALLLLSNEGGANGNLSFEREFGRLIGNLDLLSVVVSEKSSRSVARLAQSAAAFVFLPFK